MANGECVTSVVQGGVTPASDVFGGALRSEVRAQGAPPSATLEPCFLVHLDIHPENVHSITDALSAFTSPETITGASPQLLYHAELWITSAVDSRSILCASKV